MSKLMNLYTNLSPEIIKCGFPYNSLDKYLKILSNLPFEFKIIDYSNSDNCNNAFSIKDFKLDSSIKKLLEKIASINTDSISIPEAYSLLDDLKNDAIQLIK